MSNSSIIKSQIVKRYSLPDFQPVSKLSSVGLLPHLQVALVKLETDSLPENICPKLLEAQDRGKPFLYTARERNPNNYISYGDVCDFIHGGEGDLRRLGVKTGEVVAYVAPSGSAV
mmetsp:Transcript_5161/g.5692  ORF Transcript_5161/g.5692 Transcript_5161/m.5692 type:complete len:116 (+) Transcript_5161:667-1014(+)